jgi:1,4-alpha-glucan branching enzyme
MQPDGQVTFRFRGRPGRFVSLIGEFNRWDPFWEPMAEGRPGLYQVTLRLPPGQHYYVFCVDGERVPDPLNVELAEDSEGFRVSTFVVPSLMSSAPTR